MLGAFPTAVVMAVMIAAFTPVGAADETENRPWRTRNAPHFYVDAAYFPTPGAEGTLELYYDISYSQLQFLKKAGGFTANFEIQAIVNDPKGRQVTGDSWRKTVTRASYKETVSPEFSFTETFSLSLLPGKYTLVVRTENLDSGAQSSATVRLDLRNLGALPAISDAVVGLCNLKPARADSQRTDSHRADSAGVVSLGQMVVPHPRASFGERYPSMCVYAEVYDSARAAGAAADTATFRVLCRIVDEQGRVKLMDTLYVARTGLTSPFLYSPPLDSLTMGRYTLELSLGSGKGAPRTTSTFEIDESRFALDENIDDTLALLGYIARRSEIDSLKRATGPDRRRLWQEFWARRDPYPETPENEFLIEFFERVRYANANFGYFGAGWKSDRGRIYIRRGPPDSVESRPVTPAGPAYEVWYYFQQNLTFVFVDRTGLGDYQLMGPSYE
jgi:GWxTD domain-containing protein